MGEKYGNVMQPLDVGYVGLDAAVGYRPDRAIPAEAVASIRMVLLAIWLLAAEGCPPWRTEP